MTSHECHGVSWWRHQMETFSALLALCAGNSPVPVNSPHKGQWRGALMFSLICTWINDWVSNREAGDLRRHHDHYDVIVMSNYRLLTFWFNSLSRTLSKRVLSLALCEENPMVRMNSPHKWPMMGKACLCHEGIMDKNYSTVSTLWKLLFNECLHRCISKNT